MSIMGKYKKLTLSVQYEKYYEDSKNSLNSYTKNKVYYSSGEFYIYIDADKIEYGKEKLRKFAEKRFKETINKL